MSLESPNLQSPSIPQVGKSDVKKVRPSSEKPSLPEKNLDTQDQLKDIPKETKTVKNVPIYTDTQASRLVQDSEALKKTTTEEKLAMIKGLLKGWTSYPEYDQIVKIIEAGQCDLAQEIMKAPLILSDLKGEHIFALSKQLIHDKI